MVPAFGLLLGLAVVVVRGDSNSNNANGKKPHIVMFMGDDLGYGDLSFLSGSKHTPTPNIDKLAWDGVILHSYYSNPLCTPSRSCLMSSKYTFQTGMQTAAIASGEPWGLPLRFKILPQFFQELGYTTQMAGKWHLGTFHRDYFPNARGFDYAYSFMDGDVNFFNYTSGWITPVPTDGRAFRENGKAIFFNHTNNCYAPELMNIKAEQIIRNHDVNGKPLFLYFPTPLVHTAAEPYRAVFHTLPEFQLRPPVFSFSDQFPERKKLLSLVQALDESVKRISTALVNKGIADETIMVFFADNGGAIPPGGNFVRGSNYGSNWPLRFGKGTLFEGGVRLAGFIWSPLLKKRGWIYKPLFHSTDWLPTLYEAAGGNVEDLKRQIPEMAGMSHWQGIQAGLQIGPRKEIPLNIDQRSGFYAIIHEDSYGTRYKLYSGNVFDNKQGAPWWRPDGTVEGDDSWRVWTPAAVQCNFPEGKEVSPCAPWISPCLFDLTNDPCETNNIASSYPSMVEFLKQRIQVWNATSVPSNIQPFDIAAVPTKWEDYWVPWKDPNPLDPVPLQFEPLIPSTAF